ncbi:hypothetical protein PHISCL_04394 [Aspergillus sclerotialis]|uniref:SAC domain-containing protein n=1 Tax=Aspergillus sclerotialis TaxID=2070753 RepID=A0A3A2ZJ52_9EURO|nr:hypothetical protein PHISCL_04394 [Aspergillus sclerotialis]
MSRLQHILCRDFPRRTIALTTSEYALVFQYASLDQVAGTKYHHYTNATRCLVEFSSVSSIETSSYRLLGYGYGTLGLITLGEDVFLCVITGSSQAAMVRPGETVSRIDNVDFFCLTRAAYEDQLTYEADTQFAADELSRVFGFEDRELTTDHPFIALKKLLSDGSFYYSLDFNLTDRVQNR